MNIQSSPFSAARAVPLAQKLEAKEGAGPDRVKDSDADNKEAAAAAIKAAQANKPVSAVPRSPLSEAAGKLVDKLV